MSDQSTRIEIDDLQKEFLEEIRFMLDSIEEAFLKLDSEENRATELTNIFRVIHSVKGAAGAVGFEDLSAFAHIVEDLLQILRVQPELCSQEMVTWLLKSVDLIKSRTRELAKGINAPWDVADASEALKRLSRSGMKSLEAEDAAARSSQTDSATIEAAIAAEQAKSAAPILSIVPAASAPEAPPKAVPAPAKKAEAESADDAGKLLKVDSARVTSVIEMVGELVTIKSQILRDPAVKSSPSLQTAVDLLDKTVRELHDQALSLRMTSLRTTFKKIQRIARDLSVKLEKPISLAIEGEDTEMDRNLTEMITDPLVHLIRNAIDHGIENREKRKASGKNEVGIITISARQQSGRIVIEIRDDGGGIDRTRVVAKARSTGIVTADRKDSDISDKEAFGYIFAAGFSTAEKVTDVSGRGVGLDVVKTNIQQRMKGTIDIDSKLGQGTLFKLSLPLTTAITEGILSECADRKFILPLDRMREIIQSRNIVSLQLSKSARVVKVREQMIPYLSLKTILCGVPHSENAPLEETLVVMETANTYVAIGVDRVISQTQVVLKPLDRSFKDQPEISGATILGDGSVALVLDIDGLLSILPGGSLSKMSSAA